jgi:hypothetical protein
MPIYIPIEFPVFKPAARNILTITNAGNAEVTTTFNGVDPGEHGYNTGLIVRLYIPIGFGMEQGNLLFAPIEVISDTAFTIDIDTSLMDPFVIPDIYPGHFATPASCVPVGEKDSVLLNATRNVLPY